MWQLCGDWCGIAGKLDKTDLAKLEEVSLF